MPFQALPIALRDNVGDPVAKLAWIYIVHNASIDDAPNGMGWIEFETAAVAQFCQCSEEQVVEAMASLVRLGRLGLVRWKGWGEGRLHDEAWADVNLPISQLHPEQRKRIKASPDEIDRMASAQDHRCVTCGITQYGGADVWHVDHIIPRSRGGADVASNCQVLCASCNSRKGAKIHFVDFLSGRKG